MPSLDILGLLGIGVAFFGGALQMKPHPGVPFLIVGGAALISWGGIKLFWNSDMVTWTIAAIVIIGFIVIALRFAMEAYRSANVQDYLRIWERNFENWDDGKPEDRYDLTDENNVYKTMRRSIQNNPVKFTPTYNSPYDSIDSGSHMLITIQGSGLRFENDKLGEWRPARSHTDIAGQFIGQINNPIHAGQTKWGPDGVIKVHFPPGTHKIKYKIEGQTKKGREFTREGYFLVEMYDAIDKTIT